MRANSSVLPMANGVGARALLYCAGGGIGDSLVASIVARALRSRFGRVDALTLPGHRATLERVPDVDEVMVDEGELDAVAAAVAQREYDACVVTWATARTARVAQRARVPVRVGQSRRIYSFRFTHRIVVRSERGDVTSHWSDTLLDFARAIGCDVVDREYRFVPTAQDEREAEAVRAGRARFLLLNPCNAIASRRDRWPLEAWTALARELVRRYNADVLVSGADNDAAMTQAIARSAESDRVVSIGGSTGVGAFGALAQSALGFVGITTGSMHVAAAVGSPTVGIFPFQTDYPDRWAPLGKRTAVVRPSFPCHRGDSKERCVDYACVAHLDRARIFAALDAVLG
jgi:ADP-heptose:LPS heptosyltransferase